MSAQNGEQATDASHWSWGEVDAAAFGVDRRSVGEAELGRVFVDVRGHAAWAEMLGVSPGTGVRASNRGGEADSRKLERDVLDRRRIDIVAAVNDEVLGSAGPVNLAVSADRPRS